MFAEWAGTCVRVRKGDISNILATFRKMQYFLAPKSYKGSSSKQRHFSEQVASTFILIVDFGQIFDHNMTFEQKLRIYLI